MLAVLLAALESDEDRQKFIEIYEQYHAQMERTAMRILKEQSDVEDAVQNAFMQMIRHFEKIFEIPCEELPFWIISIPQPLLNSHPQLTTIFKKLSIAGGLSFFVCFAPSMSAVLNGRLPCLHTFIIVLFG